jgi:hypothetical protein
VFNLLSLILKMSTNAWKRNKEVSTSIFYYIKSTRPLKLIRDVIEQGYERYKKAHSDREPLPFGLLKAQPTGAGQNNYSTIAAFDPEVYNFLINEGKILQIQDFKLMPFNFNNDRLYPDTSKYTTNLYILLPTTLSTSKCYSYIESRLELLKEYGILPRQRDAYMITVPGQDRVKDTHDKRCFITFNSVNVEDCVSCYLFIDGTQWPETDIKVIVKWCYKNEKSTATEEEEFSPDVKEKSVEKLPEPVEKKTSDDGFKVVNKAKAAKPVKIIPRDTTGTLDTMSFPKLENDSESS